MINIKNVLLEKAPALTHAHVICCNDGIKAVILDDDAQSNRTFSISEMNRLSKKDYKENRSNYYFVKNFTEYKSLVYWHIHTYTVTQKKKNKAK
jgi:hypothetical protein